MALYIGTLGVLAFGILSFKRIEDDMLNNNILFSGGGPE